MMKLKLFTMIAFSAACLLFTSCSKDDDNDGNGKNTKPTGPSLIVEELNVGGGTTVVTELGETLNFKITAAKGDAQLASFTVKKGNDIITDQTENGNDLPYAITGTDADAYQDNLIVSAPSTESTVKYTFTIIDADGLVDEITISVIAQGAPTPLGSEESFTWDKNGANPGVGLLEFGLNWQMNDTVNGQYSAIITPLDEASISILAASKWNSTTTVEALKSEFNAGESVTEYTEISAAIGSQVSITHTYTDKVFAVKYDDPDSGETVYYMFKVDRSDIIKSGGTANVKIYGNYKK